MLIDLLVLLLLLVSIAENIRLVDLQAIVFDPSNNVLLVAVICGRVLQLAVIRVAAIQELGKRFELAELLDHVAAGVGRSERRQIGVLGARHLVLGERGFVAQLQIVLIGLSLLLRLLIVLAVGAVVREAGICGYRLELRLER